MKDLLTGTGWAHTYRRGIVYHAYQNPFSAVSEILALLHAKVRQPGKIVCKFSIYVQSVLNTTFVPSPLTRPPETLPGSTGTSAIPPRRAISLTPWSFMNPAKRFSPMLESDENKINRA